MSPDAIELVKRHFRAMVEYFSVIPDDRFLAFSVNPILVTLGVKDIMALREEDGQELVDKSKEILEKHLRQITASMALGANDADQSKGKAQYLSCLHYFIEPN